MTSATDSKGGVGVKRAQDEPLKPRVVVVLPVVDDLHIEELDATGGWGWGRGDK